MIEICSGSTHSHCKRSKKATGPTVRQGRAHKREVRGRRSDVRGGTSNRGASTRIDGQSSAISSLKERVRQELLPEIKRTSHLQFL